MRGWPKAAIFVGVFLVPALCWGDMNDQTIRNLERLRDQAEETAERNGEDPWAARRIQNQIEHQRDMQRHMDDLNDLGRQLGELLSR